MIPMLLEKGCISIHALREEGDSGSSGQRAGAGYFYPRPPRGGRPKAIRVLATRLAISIHALREEGDDGAWGKVCVSGDISIHALREEGDQGVEQVGLCHIISIHALREEGDQVCRPWPHHLGYISIHALREEGDFFCTNFRGDFL